MEGPKKINICLIPCKLDKDMEICEHKCREVRTTYVRSDIHQRLVDAAKVLWSNRVLDRDREVVEITFGDFQYLMDALKQAIEEE